MNLTKYEVARIIGARALQLAQGAPPLIKLTNEKRPVDIAIKEFDSGVIPITIERPKRVSEEYA